MAHILICTFPGEATHEPNSGAIRYNYFWPWPKEIAAQIGRSVNHVKTLIHRGRRALRRRFASYSGE